MYIEKNDTIKLLDQTAVRISDSGYAIVDCEWIMDQLPSNFSRLYFICSGEGEISYAGQTVIPRPCHMYLIPPGLQFEYGCENSMEKIFSISLLFYKTTLICSIIFQNAMSSRLNRAIPRN